MRKRSIFISLLIAFIVALGLQSAIHLALGKLFFSRMPEIETMMSININQHLQRLVEEVALMESKAQLDNLAKTIKLDFIVKKNTGEIWTTSNDIAIPDFALECGDRMFPPFLSKVDGVCMTKDRPYIKRSFAGKEIIIALPQLSKLPPPFVMMPVMFLASAVVTLMFLYWHVRRLLRPLKYLNEGVERVSSGEFETKIPENGVREFSNLAKRFNKMTESIRGHLRSREDLLVNVGHEIRTPLSRMRLGAERIDDEKTKQIFTSNIKELEILTEQIMESYRTSQTNWKILQRDENNWVTLVHQICQQFSDVGYNIEIRTIKPECGVANFDQNKMQIVLTNLISNALKYSKDSPKSIEVTLGVEGGTPFFSIKDFGMGIPQREMEKIFEPFYRIDHSRSKELEGFGLGLFIAKNIVEAHGWTIAVDSVPGEWTIFSINNNDLPLNSTLN